MHPVFMPIQKPRSDRFLGAARAFVQVIKDPTIGPILALRSNLLGMADRQDLARLAGALRSASGLDEMFANGYLAPDYRVEDLGRCAPGTLGHAYYHFITDNGLSPDYLPRSRPETDLGFHARRVEETHDIWHVVLGYQPDLPGEIGILSFFIGHLLRALKRERLLGSRFGVLLILALLAHVAAFRPRLLPASLANLVRGAQRGRSTRPL